MIALHLMFYIEILKPLYVGVSEKVWDIRGHSASLVWDIKEHKKSVTCFSIYGPLDSLLSGSTDKTIRVRLKLSSMVITFYSLPKFLKEKLNEIIILQ